jgi:hypothetical protein
VIGATSHSSLTSQQHSHDGAGGLATLPLSDKGSQDDRAAPRARADTNGGLGTVDDVCLASRQSRDARRQRRSVADADELGVALCHELGCDAGAYSAVPKMLADRLTREGQRAPRRWRSPSRSEHRPKPADLFPDGRIREALAGEPMVSVYLGTEAHTNRVTLSLAATSAL